MRFSSLSLGLAALAMALLAQQTQTINVGGYSRNYVVHAPSGLKNPPLVLTIHGQGGTGAGLESTTKMDQIADRDKFIVVYPNAINKSWDYFGAHEFAFLLAIIDTIDSQYHIDRNRIYSMGFSQGGVMSFHLACRYANTFAAIAPTSQYIWDTSCKPAKPVPMRLAFGTKDFAPTAKFMEAADKWLAFDSCPRTPVVTRPYPASNPNSLVTRLYYGPCAQGTEVVVDSIKNGTHQWQMDTTTMINNSEESWKFLKKFTLQRTTSLSQENFSLRRDAISVSYSANQIHFQGITEPFSVVVADIKGRTFTYARSNKNQLSFIKKPRGVYLVKVIEKDVPVAARRIVVQ